MPKPSSICGLDIGTQNIKILVAKKEREGLVVSRYREFPSFGVRRGVVIHPLELARILRENFLEIEQEGEKVNSVYLNIGGSHLFSLPSRGVIAVSRADQKISQEDVNRVLEAARTINLSSNKEIFDVIPQQFVIDGEKGIKEPLGLKGVKLEVEVLVLAGFSPYLNNLKQAILEAGLQILDMVPSSIAAARACLSEKEKELGVAILEIGAGTSNLAIFEEGDLIHLVVLPIGSDNITNDIAIGLKTDIEIAEKIKIEFGHCLFKGSQKRQKIKVGEEGTLIFSQKQLTNIISARVSEIFREVNKELKKIGKEKSLPAGIVLTGGGAKLAGIIELAKKEFHLPVKLRKPKGLINLDEDLSLAVVAGLVLWGQDLEEEIRKSPFYESKLISRLKRIFKIFIP